MTYGFAKLIADNLRLGNYDGKWESFNSYIKIKDINSNTYVIVSVAAVYQYEDIPYKKWFKTYYKRVPKETPVLYVATKTGTNKPESKITSNEWTIDLNHKDYNFWLEAYTWIEDKWNDKVYKHNSLIEDTFVI